MLDFSPRPQHDYPVSAKKALIRVNSLKEHNGKHAALVAVFLCLVFLICSLWIVGIWVLIFFIYSLLIMGIGLLIILICSLWAVVVGGFARWVRCVQSVNLLLPPALVINSTDGIIHNDKEKTL